jgi:hypothetical protein
MEAAIMEQAALLNNMRGRVEQCRRLAESSTDARTSEVLNRMADEGEADIKSLLAENSL